MTYVRRYVHKDWRQVLEVARAFHAESPVHSPYPFDENQVWKLLDNALGDPAWLPAVAVKDARVVGIMLLFSMPMFFGPTFHVGDLAFYVPADRRGSIAAKLMLDYGEEWARGRGAEVMRIGISTGIRDDAVERFFTKSGYHLVGRQMEKPLCALSG